MHTFCSIQSQTVSTLPFLYIIIFQRGESFDPPSTTGVGGGEIDTCAPGPFCTKFNFEQLLFKAFFDATLRRVFLAASGPKLNLLSRLCTLLFFKEENLPILLAPLMGEIDICDHGLFCTKFNFEPLLFKAFSDAMRIFGSVDP